MAEQAEAPALASVIGKHMMILSRTLLRAALIALAACAIAATARAAADVSGAKSLIDRIASDSNDTGAQDRLEKICIEAARPAAERERATVSMLIHAKLGAQTKNASRVFLLSQLEHIGGAEVVAGLSQLLRDKDEGVREGARRALAINPSATATKALITALGRSKETPWTIALVNALGERKDEAAVEKLVPLLKDKDLDTAMAAASALGRIGGTDAAKELASATTRGKPALRAVATDAYLSCADRFLAEDLFSEASAIYKKLFTSSKSNLLKIAAMQGMAAIKAAQAAGRKTRRVASQPSSRNETATPGATSGKSSVDPEIVAKWDQRLVYRLIEAFATGMEPTFYLESMRTKVKLVAVQDDGRLKVSARGMQLGVTIARLKMTDKKNIAEAVAGSDEEAHAIAAFYCLALGEEPSAKSHLSRAGKKAAEVNSAFE